LILAHHLYQRIRLTKGMQESGRQRIDAKASLNIFNHLLTLRHKAKGN
jgi:hypothetical protein